MYPANSTVPAGLSSTNVSAYASATTADGIESILNHKFFQPSAMPPPPPPPNQSNGSINEFARSSPTGRYKRNFYIQLSNFRLFFFLKLLFCILKEIRMLKKIIPQLLKFTMG